jgi:hypothetical protein
MRISSTPSSLASIRDIFESTCAFSQQATKIVAPPQ